MQAASDEEIFDHAAQDDRVVVSADTDFGTLLASRKQTSPSVILFRHGSQYRPADQAALPLDALGWTAGAELGGFGGRFSACLDG
jgi:hypothetical protein